MSKAKDQPRPDCPDCGGTHIGTNYCPLTRCIHGKPVPKEGEEGCHECKELGRSKPTGEMIYAEYRQRARLQEDSKAEGTVESLLRCATMLDTYGPDCFPANEHGQIHFARAMMDSTADEIRAFIAAQGATCSPT